MKRIDNGSSTDIWRDRWISNHPLGTPFTQRDSHSVTMVSELLTDSGQWNEELIRQTFCEFDAEAILSTMVHGRGEDFWAWEPEKNGMYSVRSAYRVLE